MRVTGGPAINPGDSTLKPQEWNVDSLTKKHVKHVQFINKLKNSNENCFILVDSRLSKEGEKDFEKLWDGPIFFNSFSSNQRGLVILFKNSLPAKNIKILNIFQGD